MREGIFKGMFRKTGKGGGKEDLRLGHEAQLGVPAGPSQSDLISQITMLKLSSPFPKQPFRSEVAVVSIKRYPFRSGIYSMTGR